MRKMKKILAVTALLVFVLLLSGCTKLIGAFENEKLRGYTDAMLNAILMNDGDSAYTLVEDMCAKSEFEPIFSDMQELLSGTQSYELKLVSINQRSSYENGESLKTVDSVYVMTTNDSKRYVISVQLSSNVKKLSTFYITPYEKTNLYYTGVITKMKDASILQWGFLLSNLLVIALMVVALIDCCRHKIKLKPLWIAIIVLGMFSIGATISASSFNLNFNLFWLAGYSAFVRYGGGQVLLRFVIPWGAPLYLILRHWLIKKPEPEVVVEATDEQLEQPKE